MSRKVVSCKEETKHLALGMLPIEEIKYMAAVEQALLATGNCFQRLYTTYDEQKVLIEKKRALRM